MGFTINQVDVLNVLHNQMGHRVNPGGTDEDLKRYVQEAFNYCWRYYRWLWSLKTFTTATDGILPEDFDPLGFYSVADTYGITWDSATSRFILDPVAAEELTYQILPPTLGTDEDGSAPFPSALVVAEGAVIFAKLGENPTRADISQEWDLFHSMLDRLVGRADAHKYRTPQNVHSRAGTHTGDVST